MDKIALIRWCSGLVGVSIIAGVPVSYLWYAFLSRLMKVPCKFTLFPRWPLTETNQFTGIVERTFFTVAAGLEMSGTAIAMIVWILAKNSILWPGFTKEDSPAQRYVNLMSGVGSMLIAIIAGEVCEGQFF
jgi:hypothetical protein